ncbi:MAG: hypothetical protein HC887_13050 [Desulfobacteraceae bacterium]|nr:hypothetical protein [Desulfobacteraceae bacterium]
MKATVSATASSKINAEAKANASASVEFGARYNGAGWEQIPPSPSFEKSCTAKIEVQGGVTGEVRLIPDIQVEFYRVAAMDISVEPFVSAEIQYETMAKADILKGYGYSGTQLTQFDVYLQAQAYVSASLGIFSKKASLLDKTKVWESEKWMLFSLPKIEINNSFTGKEGESVNLTVKITDGVSNPFDYTSTQWKIFPNTGTITPTPNGRAIFVGNEIGGYDVFFSGTSRLFEPMGRQFVYSTIAIGKTFYRLMEFRIVVPALKTDVIQLLKTDVTLSHPVTILVMSMEYFMVCGLLLILSVIFK